MATTLPPTRAYLAGDAAYRTKTVLVTLTERLVDELDQPDRLPVTEPALGLALTLLEVLEEVELR